MPGIFRLVLDHRFMQSIPETTGPFFQEYNFEDLDPEGDRDLVIERLLAYGNREEVSRAFFRYGEERIRAGNQLMRHP